MPSLWEVLVFSFFSTTGFSSTDFPRDTPSNEYSVVLVFVLFLLRIL